MTSNTQQRTIRVLQWSPEVGIGAFSIHNADCSVNYYSILEHTTHDGRMFRVAKLGANGEEMEIYLVQLGAKKLCDCLGHLRHHKCKHVAGLQALIAANKLPRVTAIETTEFDAF